MNDHNSSSITNEKAEYSAAEAISSPVEKPATGGRIKRIWRRWWWLILIVLAIGILVVVLPFVFVGIPNIAQKAINKSTLDVTEEIISDPKPNSVGLKLTNVARSDSKFHPELRPFRAALFLEDTEPDIKPFGYINIPKSKAQKETTINIDQTLDIADLEQFKRYNELVLKSETFRFGVRGRVSLKLSGLKAFTVDYNKAVTMKGLNGLAGLAVKNISIKIRPESDGTNMLGQVEINNPSLLTIEMGNVTMDLSVAGTPIGQSLIPNLTLKPGPNTADMRSVTDQAAVLGLISTNYKDAVLPIDIVGNSSVNSAGEHLEYFEYAIQNNKLSITLDVGPALTAAGVNVSALTGGS